MSNVGGEIKPGAGGVQHGIYAVEVWHMRNPVILRARCARMERHWSEAHL